MTVGYTFELTCPVCGEPVTHVTQGVPALTQTRAVIHCDTCDRDGVITVTLVMAYKPNDPDAARRKRDQRARRRVNA